MPIRLAFPIQNCFDSAEKEKFRKDDNFINMQELNGQKRKSRRFERLSMDEELRTELAEIKNMISEHNLILQKLSKQISADVAIQAIQSERAVELNRLRQTASQAIKLRTY